MSVSATLKFETRMNSAGTVDITALVSSSKIALPNMLHRETYTHDKNELDRRNICSSVKTTAVMLNTFSICLEGYF
jgi:hypothetical protein